MSLSASSQTKSSLHPPATSVLSLPTVCTNLASKISRPTLPSSSGAELALTKSYILLAEAEKSTLSTASSQPNNQITTPKAGEKKPLSSNSWRPSQTSILISLPSLPTPRISSPGDYLCINHTFTGKRGGLASWAMQLIL